MIHKVSVYRIKVRYDWNGDAQGWRVIEKTFLRPGVELTEACRELLKDFAQNNHTTNSRNPVVILAEELEGEFVCGLLRVPIAPIG